MYRVLARYPDMKRSMMVDAQEGRLVNRKFYASMFTKEQAERYVAEAKEHQPEVEFKIVKF